MPIAGCNSPQKPSATEKGNKPVKPKIEKCSKVAGPGDESKASGNRIDIVFDPDKSSKVNKCEKIVHIQFCRQYADGKVIKPGDYYSGFKYQDKVVADDGWHIDHVGSMKTPDVQGVQGGTGYGKKNGGKGKANMYDSPQTGGGDKGFYFPKTNPNGWKKVRYEFTTFAWCMKGPDCGKWYEGVQWEYTKTWEDQRDGKKGESKIIDKNVTSEPSKSQIEAFDKFNKEKGFTPCK